MADLTMTVTKFFGDGDYPFTLAPLVGKGQPLSIWRELQEKTKAGPMRLFDRIRNGDFKADDLREIIRLGLIGGGMEASSAHAKVIRYFDRDPIMKHADLALDVLVAGLFGIDPDAPLKVEIDPVPEDVAAANDEAADVD